MTQYDTHIFNSEQNILFVAMETSGDLLGAKIAKALREQGVSSTFVGIAGPQMRKAGVVPLYETELFGIMGLIDVLKKLPFLLQVSWQLLKYIQETLPTHVIFLDSPSFGLKIASKIKKQKLSPITVQVVAPSIWAWGKQKRLKALRSYIDILLPLYAFEESLFSSHVPTHWCGHPLFDTSFFISKTPKSSAPLLALFPGSRSGEVRRNLSLQLAAAAHIQHKLPALSIGIGLAESLAPGVQDWIEERCKKNKLRNVFFTPASQRYELMDAAWASLAKCGTVVLELFLKGVPCAVCYQISPFERAWAKYCLRIEMPFFSLPNILLKKKVVQEFIHPAPKPHDIALFLKPFLEDAPILVDEESRNLVLQQIVSLTRAEDAMASYIIQQGCCT